MFKLYFRLIMRADASRSFLHFILLFHTLPAGLLSDGGGCIERKFRFICVLDRRLADAEIERNEWLRCLQATMLAFLRLDMFRSSASPCRRWLLLIRTDGSFIPSISSIDLLFRTSSSNLNRYNTRTNNLASRTPFTYVFDICDLPLQR